MASWKTDTQKQVTQQLQTKEGDSDDSDDDDYDDIDESDHSCCWVFQPKTNWVHIFQLWP